MYYIAYGRLKTAFRIWTEELSKYNDMLNAKREEIVRKFMVSVMGKSQFAFMLWKNFVARKLADENLMKKMVNRMLRSAGLMVYNLFTRWKMDTFTDLERKLALRRSNIMNKFFDILDKKHRNHMKVGYSKLAGESMNTAARQRMVGRLRNACFGRLQTAWDTWKFDTFAKLKQDMERKKMKVIDEFIRSAMSPLQKSFMKWRQRTRDLAKLEFANQIKAGFTLTNLMMRFLRANKQKYLGLAFRRIGYNPDKVMIAAFQKMLRAAGANLGTAMMSWRMNVLSGNSKRMALQKRNLAAGNIGNVIDKKRKNHLRAGIRPLADGVA